MYILLLQTLACVNDCAEPGVALNQNFNGSITKGEEQTQHLLQVVEKHRHEFAKYSCDNLLQIKNLSVLVWNEDL
jgi:hypothetical protein